MKVDSNLRRILTFLGYTGLPESRIVKYLYEAIQYFNEKEGAK